MLLGDVERPPLDRRPEEGVVGPRCPTARSSLLRRLAVLGNHFVAPGRERNGGPHCLQARDDVEQLDRELDEVALLGAHLGPAVQVEGEVRRLAVRGLEGCGGRQRLIAERRLESCRGHVQSPAGQRL